MNNDQIGKSMKPTKEQIIEAANALRASDEGEAAMNQVHALLRGPLIDSENERHVLMILLGAWNGWYGTALDSTKPPQTCEQLEEQAEWKTYFENQKKGKRPHAT